jgi:hypothetical protein
LSLKNFREPGSQDEYGSDASFNKSSSVDAVGFEGNIYVCDTLETITSKLLKLLASLLLLPAIVLLLELKMERAAIPVQRFNRYDRSNL